MSCHEFVATYHSKVYTNSCESCSCWLQCRGEKFKNEHSFVGDVTHIIMCMFQF